MTEAPAQKCATAAGAFSACPTSPWYHQPLPQCCSLTRLFAGAADALATTRSQVGLLLVVAIRNRGSRWCSRSRHRMSRLVPSSSFVDAAPSSSSLKAATTTLPANNNKHLINALSCSNQSYSIIKITYVTIRVLVRHCSPQSTCS